MKFCLVIPDGSADFPQESLSGRTPLEAADVPNMDRIARSGAVGAVRTIPEGYSPGSDVAIMSVLGYEPHEYYTGRAPLEAASMGITLSDGDWAARANLVTITDGRMADYSAGHISSNEAAAIMRSLNDAFTGEGLEFHAGKSYRNLLVKSGAGKIDVTTTPPHDIAGQEVEAYLPRGPDAGMFRDIMDKARPVLAAHEVNAGRRAAGEPPATDIWLWGEGRAAEFPLFQDLFGMRPAVITFVDLVAGICALSGWERIVVPGATGYYDTDYEGKGAKGVEALSDHDLVFVHVEAPDEASHNGDVEAKVRAIEQIDSHVVGPLLRAAQSHGDYRFMVLPDHYTLLSSGAHGGEPVPFAVCGTGVSASGASGFSEKNASVGENLESGALLMRIFLGKEGPWSIQ